MELGGAGYKAVMLAAWNFEEILKLLIMYQIRITKCRN